MSQKERLGLAVVGTQWGTPLLLEVFTQSALSPNPTRPRLLSLASTQMCKRVHVWHALLAESDFN